MDEFALIAELFAPLTDRCGAHLLDDAAVVPSSARHDRVYTTDTMIAGTHFLADQPADEVAAKLARVNLSDLAAMGAEPEGYLLALALPRSVDTDWLRGFAAGLAADQDRFGWRLWGGDTTSGAERAVLTLTAIGRVPRGQAVRRGGARAGDHVYVSGWIGDGLLGLDALRGDRAATTGPAARYRRPEPRLALGQALRGVASACADVSDGLVADAGHIATASGVGLDLDAAAVPLSPAGRASVVGDPDRLRALLTGGDDYELVFTASPDAADAIARAAADAETPVTRIGRAHPGRRGPAVRVTDAQGHTLVIDRAGYTHGLGPAVPTPPDDTRSTPSQQTRRERP
ncbi:thiamine-phosphate kinase [Rhodothalassium salexigens]|uniref:thiamine-phosphate kinase n=1 Tax=Rhodothalassium salexigens TaxID=1086 RepID=UPI001912877C|nr:thiamine-phosphate kinase [Rhodothalassium salexigens]MBK5920050.1 thiamine-phosphate kinase [Rhodothalassium salexigens]